MRVYSEKNEQKLEKVICNQCKKHLLVNNGILQEGCFSADIIFGYFSNKDGIRQKFDLCEECYDKLTEGFSLPAEEIEMKEML